MSPPTTTLESLNKPEPALPSVFLPAPPAEGTSAPEAAGGLHPDCRSRQESAAVSRRRLRVHAADRDHGDTGEVEARPPPPGPAEEGAAWPA